MRSDVVDKSIQYLYHLMELFEQNNIRAWIDFGTLLGAYREKNFIAHDMDIDIGVLSEDVAALENVLNTLKAEKKILGVYDGRWEHNTIYQFGFDAHLIKIDIYVYGAMGTKVEANYYKGYAFHRFYIDELEKIQFGKFLFNCPRHLPQYLALKYGEDYMTPQVRCEKLNSSWEDLVDNVGSDKEQYTAYLPLYDFPINASLHALCKKIKEGFDKLVVGLPTNEQLLAQRLSCVTSYEKRLYDLKALQEIDVVKGDVEPMVTAGSLQSVGADFIVIPRAQYESLKRFLPIPETSLHLLS